MTALYLVSTAGGAGKTALAAALGRRFQRDQFRVRYFEPVTADDPRAELDRRFLAEQLRVPDLPPLVRLGTEPAPGSREKLAGAVARAEADLAIVEGPADLTAGADQGLGPEQAAAAMSAKVLLVTRYQGARAADAIGEATGRFGERLIGVVLNAVPADRIERAEAAVRAALETAGTPLLAVLPYESDLAGVGVAELAEQLGGQFVSAADMAGELVQNLMVGSMSLEFARDYFNRVSDKAVIVYTDKPEVQLAALESSTRCIISCGKGKPSPVVVNRSEELGIPIIRVNGDAIAVAEHVQEIYTRAGFRHPKKLQIFERLVADRLDFAALYRGLGLTPRGARSSNGTRS